MRILQVVHSFPPGDFGGTEMYTYSLSMELSKTREVYVLYPAYGGSRYDLNYLKRNGLNIYELNIPFSERIMRLFNFKSSYLDAKVEEKFRELLIKIKPDCIHFQHLIGLSASLIKIANEKGIPTVLTLHDYWFICPAIQLLKCNSTICKTTRAIVFSSLMHACMLPSNITENRILDLGCGTGILGKMIERKGGKVIFLSPTISDFELFTGEIRVIADGTSLPFKNKVFDYVVSSDVFEHIPEPKREAFIDEMIRTAKKKVIFTFSQVHSKILKNLG